MKWIKAILTYFTITLIPMILINFLFGNPGHGKFIELLKFQFVSIFFSIPYIIICLFFASELDKTKKIKKMWATFKSYFLFLLFFIFYDGLFGLGFLMMGFLIIGGPYLIVMAFVILFLSFLLKFEEKKQIIFVFLLFIILFIFDLFQLFGFFRFGLIE